MAARSPYSGRSAGPGSATPSLPAAWISSVSGRLSSPGTLKTPRAGETRRQLYGDHRVLEREQVEHRIVAERAQAHARTEIVVELAASVGGEDLRATQHRDVHARRADPRACDEVGFDALRAGTPAHPGSARADGPRRSASARRCRCGRPPRSSPSRSARRRDAPSAVRSSSCVAATAASARCANAFSSSRTSGT